MEKSIEMLEIYSTQILDLLQFVKIELQSLKVQFDLLQATNANLESQLQQVVIEKNQLAERFNTFSGDAAQLRAIAESLITKIDEIEAKVKNHV